MLPSFLSPRPKSCSNIIGKHSESKTIQDLSDEQRFRTYTVKDMKMARAYLPQEMIRDFRSGFEASAKSPPTSKSRSFVRKLVATLEGKKEEGSGHCTADEEFFTRCYVRTPVKRTLVSPKSEERIDFFDDQFAVNIKNLSQSIVIDDDEKNTKLDGVDDVAKNELQADKFMNICLSRNCDSNSNYIFEEKVDHSRATKGLPFITEEETEKDDFHEPQTASGFFFRPVVSINSPEMVYAESKNKKSAFRRAGPLEEKRSFKTVLSSLMGFKNRKSSLPKGKRNIFSTKESLGEEMRLFRRDMMPALLKAAQPYNATEEQSRDETFSSIIAASRPKSRSSDRSASIHPFYGGKKSAPTFQQIREEENSEPQSGPSRAENDFKSQDSDKVVLRKKNTPLYERPPAIIYDVPKSNKACPGLVLKKDRDTLKYENSAIIAENIWNGNPNLVPRKNIVCGKRALYMKTQRLETQI